MAFPTGQGICAALITLLVATPAIAAAPEPETPETVPGEFLLKLSPAGNQMSPAILSHRLGVEVIDRVNENIVLVKIANKKAERSALQQLRENAMVSQLEPNAIFRADKSPNDPDYKKLWGLSNAGDLDAVNQRGIKSVDISAEAAWDLGTGSKDVVVGVIDTGIDFSHVELKDQAWTNQAEANGQVGVDDDGNGFVDDIHGYNFVDDRGDATDDAGHGTHCAGTIGAKGNDGNGIAGVNWNVSLMALKFLNKNGVGTTANAIRAVDYGRKMGAHILSNSWSGSVRSELLLEAIKETNKVGILFVAAAGNNGVDLSVKAAYPAAYDVENVLAVAAVDNRGNLAAFSNYGETKVHVAAPGVQILSTVPNGKYAVYSGTSMAAPHVAGLAALLRAYDPSLSHLDLKARIMASVRPLYSLRGKTVSGGVVDAYLALSGATPPTDDPNDASRFANAQTYAFSSAHPYKENIRIERKVTVTGAKRLAIRFSKFESEATYDAMTFFNSNGERIGIYSGKLADGVLSPMTEGDSITLRFESDATISAHGFDIDSIIYE